MLGSILSHRNLINQNASWLRETASHVLLPSNKKRLLHHTASTPTDDDVTAEIILQISQQGTIPNLRGVMAKPHDLQSRQSLK